MRFSAEDVNLARVQQEIDTLAAIGRESSGGVTRLSLSTEHIEASNLAGQWMAEAGLLVRYDQWGNLLGRTGEGGDLLLSGSHLDTVPHGGNYDGVLGVLSALEALRMIRESGATVQRPLGVVSFVEEEGARYQGLLGSRLATGKLSQDELGDVRDAQGLAYIDALNASALAFPKTDIDLATLVTDFLELHIEQRTQLETAQVPIGVVSNIAGPTFMRVNLLGQADHAGTTGYEERHDSLLAAAEIITHLREIALAEFAERGYITVGRIENWPNVTNVIAGETTIMVDFRAGDHKTMEDMTANLYALFQTVSDKYGVRWTSEIKHQADPVVIEPNMRRVIEQAADDAEAGHEAIISWAAHDAMNMASIANTGMIFVPCRAGRSHSPDEYVNPEHIVTGIAVLANAMVALAGA